MTAIRENLRSGLAALELALPTDFEQRVTAYLELLVKWNRVYNLTALHEDSKLVSHHILDSVSVVPFLRGGSVLDVGTGPGLPGIPIALARPDWQITLLDSNQKKTAFLNQAVAELGITNASVRRERVESWHPETSFNDIVSRAFADLSDFARLSSHLLAPDGRLFAMKGLYPHEEISLLPSAFVCERILPLNIPTLEGQRHLVILRPAPDGSASTAV